MAKTRLRSRHSHAVGIVILAGVLTSALIAGSAAAAPTASSTAARRSVEKQAVTVQQLWRGKWSSSGSRSISARTITATPSGGAHVDWHSTLGLDKDGDVKLIEGLSNRTVDLFTSTASKRVLKAHFPFDAKPPQCPLTVLMATPFIARCSLNSEPLLFFIGAHTSWTVRLSGSQHDLYYPYVEQSGAVEVFIAPTDTRSHAAPVAVVGISSSGALLWHHAATVRVTNNGSGGDISVGSDGKGGWLVLSNEWQGPESRCVQITRLNSDLHRLWNQFFGFGCFGADTFGPVVMQGRVLFLLSGLTEERIIDVPLRGGAVKVRTLITGQQLGVIDTPVFEPQGNDLWISGFTNGQLVGESSKSKTRPDYLYAVDLNGTTSAILFRIRALNTLTADDGKDWSAYSPSALEIGPEGRVSVLAPVLQGNSDSLPFAIELSVRD
jgi:hypothetical protein